MNAVERRGRVASRHKAGGFTLLELVVAITVFGILSAMAYGGLNSVLTAKTHAVAQAEKLTALQSAFTIIERDMTQVNPRDIRDIKGQPQPALTSKTKGDPYRIAFTRGGWADPLGKPRSHLQRVAYLLQEDKLVRRSWPVLDLAEEIPPLELVLLEEVKGLELRFLDDKNNWSPEWPVKNDKGEVVSKRQLPRAIEVTVDTKEWGRISRLFAGVDE